LLLIDQQQKHFELILKLAFGWPTVILCASFFAMAEMWPVGFPCSFDLLDGLFLGQS
jgi:hypothetical protein